MGRRQLMQVLEKGLALSAALVACVLCLAFLAPSAAHADELEVVKEKISIQVEELKSLGQEVEQAQKRAKELDGEIKQTLKDIDEKQAKYAQLQSSTAKMVVELYKDSEDFNIFVVLESSTSMQELMRHLDMNERVIDAYSKASKRTAEARDALNEKYSQVSAKKDEQAELLADLQEKVEKLEKSLAELREEEKYQEKLLSVKQQAEVAQAAAAAQQVTETFETDTSLAKDDWKTGITTAYGGSSDKSTPNPGETATGTICDDWSVGVAVAMANGPEQYYGRYVEISYEGRSIVAPVVDCGYMGNGYVTFDLQPGVFKAFGCETCDDWGVREVQYRYL